MKSSKKVVAEKGPPTWDSPEYIAACEARARRFTVKYETGTVTREAILVHSYRRTAPEIKRGPIMSASSGPKDYLHNDIIALFEADERIEQVALFVMAGHFFVLWRIGAWWFDQSRPEPRHVLLTEATK